MDEVSRGFTLMHAHPVKKVSHFGFWTLLFLKGVLSGIYQFYFILENILWLCSAKFLKKLWRATNNHFSNRSFFDNKSLLFWTWNAHGLEKKQFLFQGEFLVRIRFFLPTGGTKPPPTGSGKPDRFDRLPEKTGQIQNPNQKLMFNRFLSASRPVWPVTGRFEW